MPGLVPLLENDRANSQPYPTPCPSSMTPTLLLPLPPAGWFWPPQLAVGSWGWRRAFSRSEREKVGGPPKRMMEARRGPLSDRPGARETPQRWQPQSSTAVPQGPEHLQSRSRWSTWGEHDTIL